MSIAYRAFYVLQFIQHDFHTTKIYKTIINKANIGHQPTWQYFVLVLYWIDLV